MSSIEFELRIEEAKTEQEMRLITKEAFACPKEHKKKENFRIYRKGEDINYIIAVDLKKVGCIECKQKAMYEWFEEQRKNIRTNIDIKIASFNKWYEKAKEKDKHE